MREDLVGAIFVVGPDDVKVDDLMSITARDRPERWDWPMAQQREVPLVGATTLRPERALPGLGLTVEAG